MPQDSFHIKRLMAELSPLLQGGKVNRVSQADKDEITLIIYTGFQTVKLVLSTNASFARVCLSEREKEPAPVAPNFCMLLRKHILGGEILGVKQLGNERIAVIELLCKNDFSEAKRELVAELMGKYSNLLLVENGVILGALKTTSLETSKRVLFPGAKYLPPEPQDKCDPLDTAALSALEKDYFALRERTQENVAEFIFSHVAGIALPTAREMAKRIRGEIAPFVKTFFKSEPCTPCVAYAGGKPCDFFAFDVLGAKPAPSLAKAEDIFYTFREDEKLFFEKKQRALGAARTLKKKAAKNVATTLDKLKDAQSADENKLKGELITANLYRLKKGDSSLVCENWFSERQQQVKIALDPTLPPAQNAQRYFKTYAKQKRTTEILSARLALEQAEEDYAESILSFLERAEQFDDVKEIETELISLGLLRAPTEKIGGKKHKDTPPSFRVFDVDGFVVLAGRNNLQNDRLLRDADGDDLWLHTQKYHSSHVIIKTEKRAVPDGVLETAAQICAYYSDGKNGDKIPVDYCPKKRVKKPSKAKAGFVTYTDYKTVLVSPHPHDELKQ